VISLLFQSFFIAVAEFGGLEEALAVGGAVAELLGHFRALGLEEIELLFEVQVHWIFYKKIIIKGKKRLYELHY